MQYNAIVYPKKRNYIQFSFDLNKLSRWCVYIYIYIYTYTYIYIILYNSTLLLLLPLNKFAIPYGLI